MHTSALTKRALCSSLLLAGLWACVAACGKSSPWNRDEDDAKTSPSDTNLTEPNRPIVPSKPGTPQRLEDYAIDDVAISNLADIISKLNLKNYHSRGFRGQNLKVAILDNGFTGLNHSLGKRLPPGLFVQPTSGQDMQDTTHGTKIAEIVYAVATGHADYRPEIAGPEIFLYNTNGFSNLKLAIDQVIARKIDVVVYAQVWEYGGNMDGGGFINREVSRATSAGILWINAAGNFGQSSYTAPIKINDDKSVALPHEGRRARLIVPQDKTPVKIVLSWNDFTDDQDYRSSEDLDLVLFSQKGAEIAASRLAQVGSGTAPDGKVASAHAREIISTMLDVGTYYLEVRAQSSNFRADARLRLSIDGLNVKLLDRTDGDSIMIPADNPSVLAVGAADVAWSSWRNASGLLGAKPNAAVFSQVRFDGGEEVQGSSAATAIAAGGLISYMSATGIRDTPALAAQFRLQRLASFNSSLCSLAIADACAKAPIMRLPTILER